MIPKIVFLLTTFVILLSQTGCATRAGSIGGAMLGGATVGAAVGYQFVHHGQHRQYESENTIITSAVFALAAGGLLAWHYRQLDQQQVEISGRYARYRLCDPEDMAIEITRDLEQRGRGDGTTFRLEEYHLGDLAISLDDNTKWAYPEFRKRFLRPERGESQVVSERYVWEIVRPGRFVTRSQNPRFFSSTMKLEVRSENAHSSSEPAKEGRTNEE